MSAIFDAGALQLALHRIAALDCSVRVQKYGRSTHICDCDKNLWVFLGLTREQVYPVSGKRPQVCDFPFDIWVCQIGLASHAKRRRTAFGRSFADAVIAATSGRQEP
jgi:hypothetical protein